MRGVSRGCSLNTGRVDQCKMFRSPELPKSQTNSLDAHTSSRGFLQHCEVNSMSWGCYFNTGRVELCQLFCESPPSSTKQHQRMIHINCVHNTIALLSTTNHHCGWGWHSQQSHHRGWIHTMGINHFAMATKALLALFVGKQPLSTTILVGKHQNH